MIKRIAFLCSSIMLLTLTGCRKTYEINRTSIIINELMPVNTTTMPDNYGEFDDWIELYNLTSNVIDLSGYFISDSKKNPAKWQFPSGTAIPGNGYLIVWADKDTTQSGLHTNFKLSSQGDMVMLSKPDLTVIDKVTYPVTSRELTYSRIPNGTGAFFWRSPTFNRSNDY